MNTSSPLLICCSARPNDDPTYNRPNDDPTYNPTCNPTCNPTAKIKTCLNPTLHINSRKVACDHCGLEICANLHCIRHHGGKCPAKKRTIHMKSRRLF